MDGFKAAAVLFVAAILQVAVLTEYAAFRSASIVLVALLSIALLRGSVFGAVAGFGTGLLLDTATLGTLGVTSLLLTVAGFWIGRYGETTARDRFHAPFLSVAVVTVLFAFGQVLLQFILGEPAPAGLVADGLPLALLLNLALTLPIYALVGGSSRRGSSATGSARCGCLASTNAPGGRFLPGDPRVEEPYRLTPQLAFRIAVLGFLALAIFAALFLRLWALQVLSGARYLAQANDNRVRTLSIQAPRGPVLDRSGHVLVRNVPGTRVELWPADLPKSWPAERRELRGLSMVTGVSVRDILAQLREHGSDPLTPIVVQSGLHYDQIYYLREHAESFPGVRLAQSWLRKYPFQSLAAQVLGYVGQISPQEFKHLKKSGYQPTDTIGQAGIESSYDTYLRGRDGKAQWTVDSRGRPKSSTLQLLPQPGETLRLTLDIGLQRAAERALTYGIHLAHANLDGEHADGGAIVALNPRDGSILAMASSPTYEPSVFSGHADPTKLGKVIGSRQRPTTSRR